MTSTDRVSVIVAVTRPQALKQALVGMAAQKGTPAFEVVLAWDGVVPEDVGPWPFRVVSLGLPRRGGPASAWNAAIGAATGDVLAFCDDDDIWHPDHLAAALRLLDGSADAVHGAAWVVDRSTGKRHPFHFPLNAHILRYTNPLMPSTWVLTRGAWQRVGPFDEELRFYADWDWAIRSVAAGVVWRRIEHPTVDYQWSGKNDSAGWDELRAAELKRLSARYGLEPVAVANFYAMATDPRWDRWRLPIRGSPHD